MKERPILFSGEMVRAILEGRKTQTRRVIKPSKSFRTQCETYEPHPVGGWHGHDGEKGSVPAGYDEGFYCPYGQPGDRLWVRETWTLGEISFGDSPTIKIWYRSDDSSLVFSVNENQAQRYADKLEQLEDVGNGGDNWQPSIYMPRWASRIVLEITKIKAERLLDLDITGLEKEGMSGELSQASRKFQNLWDSINAKKGYFFQTNPWVWVIEFKVVKNVA